MAIAEVPIEVRIGRPRLRAGQDDWYCPFQIVGKGDEQVKCVFGIDAVQALHLVMKMIGTELYVLNQRCGGAIRGLGSESELGLPGAE